MRVLGKLFDRPLSKDQFAQMLMKRIRASGDKGPVSYDPEKFSLTKSPSWVSFLGNAHQEYLRRPKADREQVILSFLTTWNTLGFQPSDDFADVKADLLPVLRSRGYLEVDIHRAADNFRSKADFPFAVIADHLVETLVYDLPQRMMWIDNDRLDKWGVTFYEAMEVAKRNLLERPIQCAQVGGLYVFATGDSYDASRMLLSDFVRDVKVVGDTLVMVPNREVLYVCGSDDSAALAAMIDLASKDFDHERNISGLVFRAVDADWEPWLPSESHPTFIAFSNLRVQWLAREYASQKDLLDKRHQHEGTDIFVASFLAFENRETGRHTSYCTWSRGIESLLPEVAIIAFIDPQAAKERPIVASGNWDSVRRIVGDILEPVDMYPFRWRVDEFPDDAQLKAIGNVLAPTA
jgi:Protein of unknown function (DUF1444)